jgi:hypothetical protein
MNLNSLSQLNPAFWAKEAEKSLFVENKAMAIANMTLRNLVAGEGDTVNKTIVSYPASTTYVPGTDITANAVNGTKEALTIGTWLASRVVIDDTEKAQSIIDLGTNLAHKMMMDHNNRIEQAVVAEVTNSQWTIDDGNVGGTAGNNATVNTNTVPLFFIAADTKLDAIDAPKAGRTAVVGGHFLGQLKLQQAGRPGSSIGDGVNTRGVVTNLFGWDILYSNNLPYSAILTLTVQPSDGDTVSIAGVTFTFKTTLGAVAGNVLIGASATTARANLAAALNATDTTTANFVALGAESIFLLRDKRRITAVDDVSTKITLSGYGDIVVASVFTSATNVWGSQRQDALFLVAGSIDIIVQIPPKVEVIRDPKQFADNVKSLLGMGKKTYADGARQMVRVKINAGTSDWV